jgi:hypothetical protein
MKCAYQIGRAAGIVAGVFVFAAWQPPRPALAQPAPVTLSPDLYKLPPPAPNVDPGTFSADKFGNESPGFTLPDRIDLGGSVLRFDTRRSAVDSVPRVGIDNADPALLNPGIPTRKESPLTPSYFGLTLTTPTR